MIEGIYIGKLFDFLKFIDIYDKKITFETLKHGYKLVDFIYKIHTHHLYYC